MCLAITCVGAMVRRVLGVGDRRVGRRARRGRPDAQRAQTRARALGPCMHTLVHTGARRVARSVHTLVHTGPAGRSRAVTRPVGALPHILIVDSAFRVQTMPFVPALGSVIRFAVVG